MSESYPNIQLRQRLKGLAIPFLLLIAVLGGIASIVVPQLNARLKLGRESATISSLITIRANEMQFKNRRLRFATLEELAESALLDQSYTGGKSVYGYVFSTSAVSAETYCVHATRAGGATAYHDFVVCEDGIIRMVESKTPGVVKRGEGSDLRSKLSSR